MQGGLDQSLGLAVGARPVRSGSLAFQAQASTDPCEGLGAITGPIVGRNAAKPDRDSASNVPPRSMPATHWRRSHPA